MSTTLGAFGFVAKGHYYQLSPLAADSKPTIVDKDGQPVGPDKDEDDTYLGVEKYSGVCLIAMERIFFNMFIFADDLFQNFTPELPEYGYYFPLAYVKRESEWTQEQVDEVYGPLILAIKLKWTFFSLLLIFGLASLGLGGYFGYRYKKLKQGLAVGEDGEALVAAEGHFRGPDGDRDERE